MVVSSQKISDKIKIFDQHKSAGSDGVLPRLFIECESGIVEPLRLIYGSYG